EEPEAGGAFECTDEIGCLEVPEGDPVTLGYILVISGPNETLGVDSRNGIEVAIEERGEIKGHPIELVGEDGLCSPEGGQTAATRITASPDIAAVIGTSCSSEARVAIPLITDAGLVMLSPSNTAPDLTIEDRGAEFEGYLRTAHNDLFQGRVAAEFAFNELGSTRAATIHDGSIYADGLRQVFEEAFAELGGEVVAAEAINVGDTDMRPVLTTIAAAEPDFIYYPVFVAEAGFITSQAREVEGLEEVNLMSADGALSPDFIEAAGDAAVGMYLSGPAIGESDAYATFLETYEEISGGPPTAGFHAHAYDATNIILNAIDEVSVEGEDGTLFIPRQALRDAIYATEGFEGLTGVLTCGETGDCATGEALAVYAITEEVVETPADLLQLAEIVYQP
ncbi:MAG: branched-chain amino acid ABC transporter substrate-binding protein, partial [Ardenticatenaceae bacterium]